MHKRGVGDFPYYVGVNSLSEIATREDRVCILNILGNESSQVTPVSHEFSGGNVVFGTGPGKSGKFLKTAKGNIPVYNSVKAGMAAGHKFNTAIIYLPPSGVRDGVAEVVRHNKDLKKIIILTEKVALKDSRIIRAICQPNGIDVFGANCLGVGDAWNKVRIGGALGGSKPDESLVKGSIALFSNSGNFTTTIAVYLLSKGWGTTTCVSSGKDVYIQYGPQEFFHAFNNDERSKAAVMYVEPGGYYEHNLKSDKPFVACVVGRWKAKFTRACGHAGSLAGSGDDAIAKERWFMDYFGVDSIYTPDNPNCSKKGAIVTNIAHIPEALTSVMKVNNIKPDFEPKGDLSLKCWVGSNNGLELPSELDIKTTKAVEPYNEQIETVNSVVGAQFPRQNLKNSSAASAMDRKSQVTKVHNVSILDSSKFPLESNIIFSLMKEHAGEKGEKLANIVLNSFIGMHGDNTIIASDAARENENSPNTVLSAAVSIIGKKKARTAMDASKVFLNLFQAKQHINPYGDTDFSKEIETLLGSDDKGLFVSDKKSEKAELMMGVAKACESESIFTKFLDTLSKKSGQFLTEDSVLSAIWTTLAWQSLGKKKISKHTLISLPWYSKIFSTIIGCSVNSKKHTADSFCGVKTTDLVSGWKFTETAFLALLGERPNEKELLEFTVLLGLIISNGPGTISAQGPKGAVSADGPEQPERVQINKCFTGFLTHTGYAHGGNGYEAIEFLLERFKGINLKDPGDKNHGIDLKSIAKKYAQWYAEYKAKEKTAGNLDYKKVPCINHPIFKGKPVNMDPREEFVRGFFEENGSYNIFLDFYHNLVNSLFEVGVSKNVYCVNIDAVIAVILLKIIWEKYTAGNFAEKDIENAAFTLFLFGRMVGSAAEIDDHMNRGKNMDTRTPASQCVFVN